MTDPEIDRHVPALIEAAREAASSAYVPYSNFPVGSAILDSEGRIFTGCNVENVSYGLSICAERNAVFHAVRGGGRSVIAVVVYTPTPNPTTPCGACRQVLHEFGSQCRVICVCDGTERIEAHLETLLPLAFGL